MLVEHARNNLGMADASHSEYGEGGTPVVSLLSCSLAETEITIDVAAGTALAAIHGEGSRVERTNCNYGLAPDFDFIASAGGLAASAVDDTGEVRAVERTDHPFFVATLYQPQRSSRPDAPHPLLVAFVEAVSQRAVSSTM